MPRLLAAGRRQCAAWRAIPERLGGRPWREQVEVVAGDALVPATLVPALAGIDVAYYLIHSLGTGEEFARRDRDAAAAFGAAARAAGVRRIIYLGGLGDPATALSHHLRSRQETGAALREAGVPVTEFRAGVVVGSGSLSFEMIRYLTERVPVMICPRWVFTRTQPIAIRNVLDYLVAALEQPESAGQVDRDRRRRRRHLRRDDDRLRRGARPAALAAAGARADAAALVLLGASGDADSGGDRAAARSTA